MNAGTAASLRTIRAPHLAGFTCAGASHDTGARTAADLIWDFNR